MSRLVLIALMLLAVVLIDSLILEWRAGTQDAEDAANAAQRASFRSADPTPDGMVLRPTGPQPAALLAVQLQHWRQATLERPLFEPGRRPVSAAIQPKVVAAPRLPRLAGVLISSQRRQVIFAGGDGKPIIIGEGETIDGFTVQKIAAGQVTVLGPDGPLVLHPSFDPDRRPPQSPLAVVPPPIAGIPGLPGVQQNIPAIAQRGQPIPPSSD